MSDVQGNDGRERPRAARRDHGCADARDQVCATERDHVRTSALARTWTLWRHEWRLFLRSGLAVSVVGVLALLAALAVASGLREVERQRAVLEALASLQRGDLAAVARRLAPGGSAGHAAYYSFHAAWDPPGDAAFLALGLRDLAPQALRVRALGLQGQLYDGETFNPERVALGRFDLAFVLVYLVPLFVIVLTHDLLSGEREQGRWPLLRALPGGLRRLWWRRVALRGGMLALALLLPLLEGAAGSGMGGADTVLAVGVAAAYLLFWLGLGTAVAARGGRSGVNATILTAAWAVLTLVLPVGAQAVVERRVPLPQGIALTLAHRQAVHAGWDLPREETLARFLDGHPAWRHTAPLPPGFHWKWYFAFHQLADEQVRPQARAYLDGLAHRQRWTERLGLLVPSVGAVTALQALAATDLGAQVAFLRRVETFHDGLRAHYYPYLFEDRRYGAADHDRAPRYAAPPVVGDRPLAALAGLAGLAALAWGAAAWAMAQAMAQGQGQGQGQGAGPPARRRCGARPPTSA